MTTDVQKLALLEWAGWKRQRTKQDGVVLVQWFDPQGKPANPWPVIEKGPFSGYTPDLDSLDCLAEFEAKLTPEQCISYIQGLTNLTACENRFEVMNRFAVITATTPQRLEALVRTLGLWREGE